jgi:hypothetical protein
VRDKTVSAEAKKSALRVMYELPNDVLGKIFRAQIAEKLGEPYTELTYTERSIVELIILASEEHDKAQEALDDDEEGESWEWGWQRDQQ